MSEYSAYLYDDIANECIDQAVGSIDYLEDWMTNDPALSALLPEYTREELSARLDSLRMELFAELPGKVTHATVGGYSVTLQRV